MHLCFSKQEQIYIHNNVILRLIFDFSCSPRTSQVFYTCSHQECCSVWAGTGICVHSCTHTCTDTHIHTLPVREPEKAVYVPLRQCQIAQATRAREDPKDLLVSFLTQLIVLLHGHTLTTISAQAWSSSDRHSLVPVLVLTHLNVGTQFSVKPFQWLSTF